MQVLSAGGEQEGHAVDLFSRLKVRFGIDFMHAQWVNYKFKFSVKGILGKNNVTADALSRFYDKGNERWGRFVINNTEIANELLAGVIKETLIELQGQLCFGFKFSISRRLSSWLFLFYDFNVFYFHFTTRSISTDQQEEEKEWGTCNSIDVA